VALGALVALGGPVTNVVALAVAPRGSVVLACLGGERTKSTDAEPESVRPSKALSPSFHICSVELMTQGATRGEMMSTRTRFIAIGTSIALAAGGAGLAVAADGQSDQAPAAPAPSIEAGEKQDRAEGPDVPIAGNTVEDASAAALAATGEGKVTETEEGDEESYYEVEVTLDDGSQVDVQLDRDLNVVGQSADSENDG